MKKGRKHLFLMFRYRRHIALRHRVYCDEIQMMEEGQTEWDDERYSRLVDLEYDLDELMDYIDSPVVFLPDHLYMLAKDTIDWIRNKE